MRILGCWDGKKQSRQAPLLVWSLSYLPPVFSKHTKLITRDKVYNMLGNLPQMVFGNLKKNLSRMQRRRFDDLDVDKNRSLNTRGKGWFWINLMQGQVLPPLLSPFSHFNEPVKKISFTGSFCQLFSSIAFPFPQTKILTQYEDKEKDAWNKRCQEQPKELLF